MTKEESPCFTRVNNVLQERGERDEELSRQLDAHEDAVKVVRVALREADGFCIETHLGELQASMGTERFAACAAACTPENRTFAIRTLIFAHIAVRPLLYPEIRTDFNRQKSRVDIRTPSRSPLPSPSSPLFFAYFFLHTLFFAYILENI